MACDFRKNKDQIMGEFESYYAKMPFDTGRQQKQLDEWLNEKQYTHFKRLFILYCQKSTFIIIQRESVCDQFLRF